MITFNIREFIRFRPVIYALLSAVLLILSFPNFNVYLLAWVALVPLLLTMGKRNLLQTFLLGLLTGTVANMGMLYWLFPMIRFNTDSLIQATVCLVVLSGYLGLYVGVWALSLRYVKTQFSVLRYSFFAAALWVALEYLRSYLLTGFPWNLLGTSQWQFVSLIQISEFTGVYGVSFLLVLANVAFAQVIRTRKVASFVAVLAGILCVALFGKVLYISHSVSSPPYLTVAVVQGNIDQYKKWDARYIGEIMDSYTGLVEKAARANPDVIIWPETAVPGYLPIDARMYAWVSSLSARTRTFNIVGTPYNNGGHEYFNAVALFGPEGEILGWHKKTHLVPFGEFVPFKRLLAPFFDILTQLEDFTRGTDHAILPVKSVMWGPTICSENFFPSIVRGTVRSGAGILVNITNDAWFFKTAAPYQHFIMNVFRAVENRRPIVVCGNTGVSGMIDPTGAVTKKLPIFVKDYFVAKVSPSTYVTFYTRWGDVFVWLCCLMILVTAALLFIGKTRKQV